jgi:hypothetical protein
MTSKSLVSLPKEKEIVTMYQEKLRIDWTGPKSGFYARYAIQRDTQRLSLFMTALKPTLTNYSGNYRAPNFSPLPVAVVIDFSPEDLRMASGFKEAGYRIGAAIGYDTQCYQPWKVCP